MDTVAETCWEDTIGMVGWINKEKCLNILETNYYNINSV